MNYKLFIGIDTAKAKYDFSVLDEQGKPQLQGEIPNTTAELTTWLQDLLDGHQLDPAQVLICIERSGIYCYNLAYAAREMGFHVWMEDAYHLSRSFGRTRGKTDAIDAARIAKFAQRNYQDVKLFKPAADHIARIKSLVGQRERLVKCKNQLLVPINEEADFLPVEIEGLHDYSTGVVAKIIAAIAKIDDQIDQMIAADEELSQKCKVATSVPGFGKVNFRNLLIQTHGFTRLMDARSLACSIGIAPFPRQSGKCLNKKPTSGKMGNKKFKTTLTCAVQSIIRSENHFGKYYRRKIATGKKHLVVVNALRNKMIHTVMACVNNDTMYYEKHQHELA